MCVQERVRASYNGRECVYESEKSREGLNDSVHRVQLNNDIGLTRFIIVKKKIQYL